MASPTEIRTYPDRAHLESDIANMARHGWIVESEQGLTVTYSYARSSSPFAAQPVTPLLTSQSVATSAKPKSSAGKILGSVVVLVIAYAVLRGGTSATAPSPAATGAPVSAPLRANPVTLVDLSGSGIKKTRTFTATGPWTIRYNYDCTDFGLDGNFQVMVEGDDFDVAVNELGKSGTSSTQEYATGTLYLDVNSECDWHVAASQP